MTFINTLALGMAVFFGLMAISRPSRSYRMGCDKFSLWRYGFQSEGKIMTRPDFQQIFSLLTGAFNVPDGRTRKANVSAVLRQVRTGRHGGVPGMPYTAASRRAGTSRR